VNLLHYLQPLPCVSTLGGAGGQAPCPKLIYLAGGGRASNAYQSKFESAFVERSDVEITPIWIRVVGYVDGKTPKPNLQRWNTAGADLFLSTFLCKLPSSTWWTNSRIRVA